MKTLPLALLFGVAPCIQAAIASPSSAAGYTIFVDLYQAQQCSTEMYQEPTGAWFDMPRTPLSLQFPVSGGNTYTAAHPHNSADTRWPDIQVSYAPDTAKGKAYVKVENRDFSALLILSFTEEQAGTAYVYLHEDGQTHHMRHVNFRMHQTSSVDEPIILPEIDDCDGDPQILDDGLCAIISELENTTAKSATDKLYRKRLLTLLPLIQMSGNTNLTLPETKGNTALHYACGMSHLPLVAWLLAHGADTEAVTNKGATVDACVSGKNARAIRDLLSHARTAGPPPLTPEQKAAAAGKLLEAAFSCKDLDADLPDAAAAEEAETLFRYVNTTKKHPFGVDEFSRMGRMLTWALTAKLSVQEFSDTVVTELREMRAYKQTLKAGKKQ